MSDLHGVQLLKNSKKLTRTFRVVPVFFKFRDHLTLTRNEVLAFGDMHLREY
jgi:hypothetical protein